MRPWLCCCVCLLLFLSLHTLRIHVPTFATSISQSYCRPILEWLQVALPSFPWARLHMCADLKNASDLADVWFTNRTAVPSVEMPFIFYAGLLLPIGQSYQLILTLPIGQLVSLLLYYAPYLYHYLFTISCLLYWLFYDTKKSIYVSHIYRVDKYGVVLNYVTLSVIHAVQFLVSLSPWYPVAPMSNYVWKLGKEVPFFAKAITVSVISVTTFLTGMKIILFNLIFKQHSSPNLGAEQRTKRKHKRKRQQLPAEEGNTTHERLHMIPILLLGCASVFTTLVLSPYSVPSIQRHPFAAVLAKLCLLLPPGVAVFFLGRYAKARLDDGNPSVPLNFIVILLECLMIEESLRLP